MSLKCTVTYMGQNVARGGLSEMLTRLVITVSRSKIEGRRHSETKSV